MRSNEENIKLIFGIKLRQLRHEKKLSLSQLSKLTGISISYLNEIEKGKKYPKANKIMELANALKVDYNYLVSLKLSKKLTPIADLLKSNIFSDLPLDIYGISKSNLIELLSDAPLKLSAFVSTIIQISRNYDMTVDNFYSTVLTSYIELNNNYFESIEKNAISFLNEFNIGKDHTVYPEELEKILKEEYGYVIDEDFLSFHDYLKDLDSVTKLNGENPVLFLNKNLNNKQRAYVVGLELGYNFLGLAERPCTSNLVEKKSFEEVLNHYKASYFANALLMDGERLARDMEAFFKKEKFDPDFLIEIKEKYNASTEMFVNRLVNIIPKYFKLNEMLLFIFSHELESPDFSLEMEMHLAGIHSPHANLQAEYYCRRWKGISIIKEFEEIQKKQELKKPLCGVQISNHITESKNEYLIISFARNRLPSKNVNMSISFGLEINDQLKKTVKFWNDPEIEKKQVGNTCERCPIIDCSDRVAEAKKLEQRIELKLKKEAIRSLVEN